MRRLVPKRSSVVLAVAPLGLSSAVSRPEEAGPRGAGIVVRGRILSRARYLESVQQQGAASAP